MRHISLGGVARGPEFESHIRRRNTTCVLSIWNQFLVPVLAKLAPTKKQTVSPGVWRMIHINRPIGLNMDFNQIPCPLHPLHQWREYIYIGVMGMGIGWHPYSAQLVEIYVFIYLVVHVFHHVWDNVSLNQCRLVPEELLCTNVRRSDTQIRNIQLL